MFAGGDALYATPYAVEGELSFKVSEISIVAVFSLQPATESDDSY